MKRAAARSNKPVRRKNRQEVRAKVEQCKQRHLGPLYQTAAKGLVKHFGQPWRELLSVGGYELVANAFAAAPVSTTQILRADPE
jgi:hypothetical protein